MTKHLPTIVVYHDRCWDGCTAAVAAQIGIRRDTGLDPLLVAGGHGRPAEVVERILQAVLFARLQAQDIDAVALIEFVDFCLPELEMRQVLAQPSVCVRVLDHHISALPVLKNLVDDPAMIAKFCYVYDVNRSGAGIAYDELVLRGVRDRDLDLDWLFSYIEDRDLWRFALPSSKEVNAAIQARDCTPYAIMELHQAIVRDEIHLTTLETEGRAILRAQRYLVADIISKAKKGVVIDEHAAVLALTPVLVSEAGAALLEKHKDVALAILAVPSNGGDEWSYSLRSRTPGIDVAVIAASRKGGGHRAAASFRNSLSPSTNMKKGWPV